jgi:threonine/homoserine/homoserine lactone efflux protein
VSNLAAFVGFSLLVIVIPGQDTALTIRNTLAGGRRVGLATALGVVSGQATWTLATSAGLAAVLLASQTAFTALKLVGAAYLVYLGACALLEAARGRRHEPGWGGGTRRPRAAYRRGLLSNLGNPKIAVFFTSLLPQFGSGFLELLGLGLLFATLTLLWLTPYVLAVAKAGDVLRRARVRRWLDAGLRGGTRRAGPAARRRALTA